MYLNEVTLVGFLSKEPEVHYIDNGIAIAKLTLCTKEKGFPYSNNENVVSFTQYHTIILTNKLAVEYELLLHENSWVKVVGRIAYRNISSESNHYRLVTEIVAKSIKIIDQ